MLLWNGLFNEVECFLHVVGYKKFNDTDIPFWITKNARKIILHHLIQLTTLLLQLPHKPHKKPFLKPPPFLLQNFPITKQQLPQQPFIIYLNLNIIIYTILTRWSLNHLLNKRNRIPITQHNQTIHISCINRVAEMLYGFC